MKAIFVYFIVISLVVLVAPVVLYRYFIYVVLNKPRDYKKIYKLNNFVFKLGLKANGATYEVFGMENLTELESGFLVVSNHQSYFDIPILSIVFKEYGVSFVAKKNIKKALIIAQYMEVMNCIFLDRDSVKSGMQLIKDGAKLLNEGVNLVIFPEGTRCRNGDSMQEFKAGSLKIATRAKKPIVPVTIDGSYDLHSDKFKMQSSNVKVTIHKPITIDDYDNLKPQDLNKLVEDTVRGGF